MPLTVTAISPVTGVNTVAQSVAIAGTGIQSGCTAQLQSATLGNVDLTGLTCSPTGILATVPAGTPAGFYALGVDNPDGQTVVTPDAYTVFNPTPVVLSVSPALASAKDTPLTITITGAGFSNTGEPGVLQADLNGASPAGLTFVNSTTLTALVPASPPGRYSLTVTNPGPGNPAGSLADALTLYTLPPDPPVCNLVDNCPEGVTPDGVPATLQTGGTLDIDLGEDNGVTDGPGVDLVYYEFPNTFEPPDDPFPGQGIYLDFITVTLSIDRLNWYPVFAWDGQAGGVAGSNMEPFASDANGEMENEPIPAAWLYPYPDAVDQPINAGIAIDLAGVDHPLPAGQTFRYIRFEHNTTCTARDCPAEVDGVLVLN